MNKANVVALAGRRALASGGPRRFLIVFDWVAGISARTFLNLKC